ncbi:hypothetical protein KIW84_050975 [Lathyrus oleraceus]|uniref:Uncharacterized protein n=1 Tax=Pisum sativum TaxID=3888 RepID=A0A9D4WLE6_PEA|nr:hypothetical protein KIW84_050975 [Pisum sativum]
MVSAIPLPTFLFSSSHTFNFRILKVKVNTTLITNSDWFQVDRPIGNYGFMNVTTNTDQYSFGEEGGFKSQDVQEGFMKEGFLKSESQQVKGDHPFPLPKGFNAFFVSPRALMALHRYPM